MKARNNILLLGLLGLLAYAAVKHSGNPDQPGPGPDPGPGSRRILLYAETAPNPPYTHDQDVAIAALQNGELREWVMKNCKDMRNFDPDQDVSGQTKFWQDAFADAKTIKTPPPWVRVYNGWRWNKERPITTVEDLKKTLGAQ